MTAYTLEVTEVQARVLVQATEVLARLGIGQFRDALDCLPTRERVHDGWHTDMDVIGKILAHHMIGGVDGYTRSLSVHSVDVSETSRIAWDLYQVLRHRLAWDRAVAEGVIESADAPRKWHKMFGVHYDEPSKVSEQPLATMEGTE